MKKIIVDFFKMLFSKGHTNKSSKSLTRDHMNGFRNKSLWKGHQRRVLN